MQGSLCKAMHLGEVRTLPLLVCSVDIRVLFFFFFFFCVGAPWVELSGCSITKNYEGACSAVPAGAGEEGQGVRGEYHT